MTPKDATGPRYNVQGGAVLHGRVAISGAKNAALAMMCASLLTDEDLVLTNIPEISDCVTLGQLLESLGAKVQHRGDELRLNGASVGRLEAPTELINENRASFQITGPLLARHGYAASAPPGGDSIGQRPIEVHLKGFEAMGATVTREGERYLLRAPNGLQGARIFMDYPSVTGTQNVLMAAVLARGHTTIVNAATEPEVEDLANMLRAMGAKIDKIGTQILEIDGVDSLRGTTARVMPDRIEAGTYAIAAAITRGSVTIEGAPVNVMDALLAKLRAAGCGVTTGEGGVLGISYQGPLKAVSFQALPYPGLATDLQAPLATLLTQAEGTSIIHERVFDNRMLYVEELRKMGAEIAGSGSVAFVSGPRQLTGTRVRALDIRAGVSVMLAGLAARGTTIIDDGYHLDRGYGRLDEKLRALGAVVERA